MNKIVTSLALITSLSISLCAQEEHTHKSDFYIATKALMTLGDTVEHGEATLDGSSGYGLGVDFGYKIGKGFAVEVDATYAKNDVTERDVNEHGHEHVITASGLYVTTSLDLVYAYPLTHQLEIFIKGGYEYEIEKISDLDIDTSDTGFIYAAGLEYELNENLSLLGEYEATTIEGPRGNSIFAGVVYHF